MRDLFGWLPRSAGAGLAIPLPIPNLPASAPSSFSRGSSGNYSSGATGEAHDGEVTSKSGQAEGPSTTASSSSSTSGGSDADHQDGGGHGSSDAGSPSRSREGSDGGSVGSSLGGAVNDATNTVSGAASKILTGEPQEIALHTTGYSFQDNTPRNSNTISCGIIHKVAGGAGTYDNPITVAVPGSGGKGAQIPCGTRIYYKKYQFYGIVEDTGATDYSDAKHTDIYVDGENISKAASDKCMDPVTTPDGSPTPAILNPPPNLPVRPAGPITTANGCDVGGSA